MMLAAIALCGVSEASESGGEVVRSPIVFGRDIRPLLSDRCFICHGPDAGKRKGKLRLDAAEFAVLARENGAAIVPGDAESSLLWQRINAHDLDEQMPPSDSGRRPLSEDERARIRQWIDEGAVYASHWAFVPPKHVQETATVKRSVWSRGPIDDLVEGNAMVRGQTPSNEADRATLCRRLFLDLTGLPPNVDELVAFESDPRCDAYERLVHQLLYEEPYATRVGERMSVPWLDLARYADTIGLHTDAGRNAWPWRDWVIQAFRTDMPFDRFVVEQLAGDLIPGATSSQVVASGFNRQHVVTDEGGAISEEYLFEYAVDRTATVGTAFLGLTIGCARCHDHKFDPVSAQEFYGLLAYFNNVDEPGLYSQLPDPTRAFEPAMSLPDPVRDAKLEEVRLSMEARTAQRDAGTAADGSDARAYGVALRSRAQAEWTLPTVLSASADSGATLAPQPDGSLLASGATAPNDGYSIVLRTEETSLRAIRLDAIADPSLPGGRVGRASNGNAILSHIEVVAVSIADPTVHTRIPLDWAWADVEQSNSDFRVVNALRSDDDREWAVNAHMQTGDRQALFLAMEPFGFEGGTELHVRLEFQSPYASHSFGRVRLALSPLAESVLAELPVAMSDWSIIGPFKGTDSGGLYSTEFGPELDAQVDYRKKYFEQTWRHAPGVVDGQLASLAQGAGVEYLVRTIYAPSPREYPITLGSDDGIAVYLNGEKIFAKQIERGVALDQEAVTLSLRAGANTLVCKVVNTGGLGGFAYRAVPAPSSMTLPEVAWLPNEALDANEVPAHLLLAWRMARSPRWREQTAELSELASQRAALEAGVVSTMVMRERALPRDTYVMTRGQYNQPDSARPATRSIPVALGALHEQPSNRLELAEWIVSDQNPLFARVTVNRFWEQLFGRGLVETSEDFGLQGAYPSNPELLDWLALDFQKHGWSVKHLFETMVTSATYRQSSERSVASRGMDPLNTFLCAYPRQRLTAEQIRDQLLFVSGLLVETTGGPGVKPYQPETLWQEVAMPASNTSRFVRGVGSELWRRSVYTYWKRASPPPSMQIFDAPSRESCTPRRITTNTPLQALALWNDEQAIEAARALAGRLLTNALLDSDALRVDALVRVTTGQVPTPAIRAALFHALALFRERYGSDESAAIALIAQGDSMVPPQIAPAELATWTMLANAMFASDAALVKD